MFFFFRFFSKSYVLAACYITNIKITIKWELNIHQIYYFYMSEQLYIASYLALCVFDNTQFLLAQAKENIKLYPNSELVFRVCLTLLLTQCLLYELYMCRHLENMFKNSWKKERFEVATLHI